MIGISVYIDRRLAYRHMINMLSSLGDCVSYSEAMQYGTSSMLGDQHTVSEQSFRQFVFDNACFNIRILDGHGILLSMDGDVYVMPVAGLKSISRTERIKHARQRND